MINLGDGFTRLAQGALIERRDEAASGRWIWNPGTRGGASIMTATLETIEAAEPPSALRTPLGFDSSPTSHQDQRLR